MAAVSTPRPRLDAGAIAGSFAVAVVLVVWFVVENGLGSNKQTEAQAGPSSSASNLAAPFSFADPAPATLSAPVATQSAKPWQPAIDLGREGIKQLEAAFKQHEKAGNPLRFRSQTDKAKKKLEAAIESLDVTLEGGKLSGKDAKSVRAWRENFANAIRYTRK